MPRDKQNGSILFRLFGRRLPLEQETCWFILVNVLDIVLTYLVLQHEGYTEGNPVARFFLYSWGSRGLLYFKLAMVAFVTLTAQLIALKKPATAQRLLIVGTVIVTGVLVYSLSLLLKIYNIL